VSFFHDIADHLDERKVRKMLTMQDISNWQGPKAIDQVAHHEVLAIKATEGNNFLDPDFAENWKFAKDNEKARIAYHVLHPSQPGLQQAQFFLNYINTAGIETGDMFALDMELADGKAPEEVAACAREFLDHVASITKANPFVYTFIYFAVHGNCAGLENRPLWIADPSHAPTKPEIPHPWTEWTIHQYGIFRGIDADVVNVENVESLDKYGALIGQPEPPPHIVTLTLHAGESETRREFDENATISTLRGLKLAAGDAELIWQ
jgi:GH25 family lysozyme M1 (1,4-beta-N-acetylmuramidase)